MGVLCAVVVGLSSQAYPVTMMPQANPYAAQLASSPCGPDWLVGPDRALIPQSWKGADFRSACSRHDACLDQSGYPVACDATFRRDLMSACQYSSNPWECRRVANLMYRGVRMYSSSGQLTSAEKNYAVARLRAVNARFGRNIPTSGYRY